MLRTQIYLPEELSQELKLLALKEAKTTAEVIRKLLKEGLKKQKKKSTGAFLEKLASMAGRGHKDLSSNFYDYAYGKKSSYAKGAR